MSIDSHIQQINTDALASFLHQGAIASIDEDNVAIAWADSHWVESPNGSCGSQPSIAFYFPDFFLQDPKPWRQQQSWAVVSKQELVELLSAFDVTIALDVEWQPIDWSCYDQAFLELQRDFAARKLTKAVPFVQQAATCTVTPQRLAVMLKKLLQTALSAKLYPYGFWDGTKGLLGATPEKLFALKANGKQLFTMACAGTCATEAFFHIEKDEKICHEHRIVVEDIYERLQSLGKVQISSTEAKTFGRLTHLVTPIELQSEACMSFEDAVEALHPTPALGAYPRKEGERWLLQLEQHIHRHHFGAPVACCIPGSEQVLCLVAIRAVEWSHSQIIATAGGGVVASSELKKEKEEIAFKFAAIKASLDL